MANVAWTYNNQGRGKKAEEMGVQVMEIRASSYADQHERPGVDVQDAGTMEAG